MPYGFSFDLSRISQSFFKELTRVTQERKLHKKFGVRARYLAEKFRLQEITGLDVPNALQLVEDLIDMHMRNVSETFFFCRTVQENTWTTDVKRSLIQNYLLTSAPTARQIASSIKQQLWVKARATTFTYSQVAHASLKS